MLPAVIEKLLILTQNNRMTRFRFWYIIKLHRILDWWFSFDGFEKLNYSNFKIIRGWKRLEKMTEEEKENFYNGESCE